MGVPVNDLLTVPAPILLWTPLYEGACAEVEIELSPGVIDHDAVRRGIAEDGHASDARWSEHLPPGYRVRALPVQALAVAGLTYVQGEDPCGAGAGAAVSGAESCQHPLSAE